MTKQQSRLARSLNPRATYAETDHKSSRVWWVLFIAGWLTLGAVSLVTLAAVRSDKKLVKQMALVSFYIGVASSVFIIGAALAQLQFGSGGIGLVADMALLASPAVVISFAIAWYVQGRIDGQQRAGTAP